MTTGCHHHRRTISTRTLVVLQSSNTDVLHKDVEGIKYILEGSGFFDVHGKPPGVAVSSFNSVVLFVPCPFLTEGSLRKCY